LIVLDYVAVWVAYALYVQTANAERADQLGDAFRAFNAFVSGLAVLGVVGAIILQRDQLGMQAVPRETINALVERAARG
jgi:hypothetical protein